MLNYGLNHGLFFSLFKFFGWKYILNLIEDSGWKSRTYIVFKQGLGFTWCTVKLGNSKLVFVTIFFYNARILQSEYTVSK